jgi:UDP-N-acetylmuramoyl-tripeptide--D-alanyl-D-alanine ligase
MMSLRAAAEAMNGELRAADGAVGGISTDTRTLTSRDLFFALKGERFDAARFLDQAFARGAAAAVVERGSVPTNVHTQPLIVVDDARAALGRLAANWRLRFTLPLVGLTGSNGKTTVKEMIAAVLRHVCDEPEQVLATPGNLNNDIGVPLTLLGLRALHRYAVIEMGMNHAGEIRYLTRLARPSVALINNAGSAHIGLLGSVAEIAAAKGEIYEGLEASGIAVVNADEAFAPLWRGLNPRRRIIEFGLDAPAEVTGRYRGHALHSEIVLRTPSGAAAFELQAPGVHNVRNALAAAAVAVALEVPADTIARGLASFGGFEGRMQRRQAINGAVLIDDTYNANPDSMRAAIAVLAQVPGKRVLVLGDMAELGNLAPELHAQVGQAARDSGIERLLTLGEFAQYTCAAFGRGGQHFSRIEDLLAALELELDADTTMLVKGSRSMRMERVVQAFEVARP